MIRIGLVGAATDLAELRAWLERVEEGVAARTDTRLTTLFPAFPGLSGDRTFRARLDFPDGAVRLLRQVQLKTIGALEPARGVAAAAQIVADEIALLLEQATVDVVLVARPQGVADGSVGGPKAVGHNFHDLLKARVITLPTPIQIIRAKTWRGGRDVEDEASRVWNLFAALYYKAGGKPWRLVRDPRQRTRCFVGVSFTRSSAGEQLHSSVAQVFNELGDGVVVRGGKARRSGRDRQPHLTEADSSQLLRAALERYRQEHGAAPAEITLHKTSSFSENERRGFSAAMEAAELFAGDLVWITESEDALLVRGSSNYPPMRGTLLRLDRDHHALYTHGSVPYYKAYPGMHIPRPLGIRPALSERPIEVLAREVLALSKLNWNRARLDARLPITLLTARRVGEILRHVPDGVAPAARYAHYM